jgi:hypothetical protein
MAQSGYTPLQLYYSTTTTNTPLSANLNSGELAINITDGKLFYKDNTGTVQVIASKAAANGVLSFNTRTGAVTLTAADVTTALGSTAVTNATNATNILGGVSGSLPYQTASGATSLLSIGTTGQVLGVSGGLPAWQTFSTTIATNLAGGTATQIPVQTGASTTSFITAPSVSGTFLRWNGTTFDWSSSTATASSISGGAANQLLYQSAANTTAFATAPVSANSYLSWTGSAFAWTTSVAQATNIVGGAATQIPYQTAANTTSFITAPSTSGTFLRWNGTTFDWASSTGTAASISGGAAFQVLYQSGPSATSFIAAPGTSGTVLGYSGSGFGWVNTVNSFSAGTTGLTPSTATSGAVALSGVLNAANGGTGVAGTLTGVLYGNGTSPYTVATASQITTAIGTTAVTNATNATTATNIAGGAANQINYQTGSGATSFITAPTVDSTYLKWNTSGGFSWATVAAGTTTNAVTFTTGGGGGTAPQTFNGSSAVTISYNTIGAAAGNSSGVYTGTLTSSQITTGLGYTPVSTSGSYSNPSWLTSISGSIVSGAVSSASLANNVTGVVAVANGGTGASTAPNAYGVVYGNSAGTGYTSLSAGTSGYLLQGNGSAAPSFVAPGTLTVGSAVNVTGTVAVGNGGTGLTSAGTSGYALRSTGSAFSAQKLGLGMTGEVWNNVTSSRSLNTTYTNSNAYPIQVIISCSEGNSISSSSVSVNGVTIFSTSGSSVTTLFPLFSFNVPPGQTYSTSVTNLSLVNWVELY